MKKTSNSATRAARKRAAPRRRAASTLARDAAGELREVPSAVYSRLHAAHAPLTAYDLIEHVQRSLKRRLHPPTIYRALAQLVEKGLVHRLESSAAYIACAAPGSAPHHSILFACDECGGVEEGVDERVHALLKTTAGRRRFEAHSEVIEVRGHCSSCRGTH